MPKLVSTRCQKLIKMAEFLGFEKRDAEGSHVFFRHPDGRTTVIPNKRKEASKGLLRKILNDMRLSVEDYEKLRKKF